MKFETEEKTIEINRFFQRIFYSFLLLLVLVSIIYLNEGSESGIIIFLFTIPFILLIIIHIFVLSKYTWTSLIINWIILIFLVYKATWDFNIRFGKEGGLNLSETMQVLIIQSIPVIILTFLLFYFRPKRYNKQLNKDGIIRS